MSKFLVLEKNVFEKGLSEAKRRKFEHVFSRIKRLVLKCRVSNSREGFLYANVSDLSEKIAKNQARVLRLPSAMGGTIALTTAPSKPAALPFAFRPFLSPDAIVLDTRSLAYDVMQVKVLTRQFWFMKAVKDSAATAWPN